MATLPVPGIDAKLRAELDALLSEELSLCESLLSHILHEQTCLRDHDHIAFENNAEPKNAVIKALRELDQRRHSFFGQLKNTDLHNPANQSFELWLSSFQRDPSLSELIKKLRLVATTCATENQSLGRLIQLQARFFDFMLNQLLPQRMESTTYLSSGEQQKIGDLRKLASA